MFCRVLIFLTHWVGTTFCARSCVKFEFAQEMPPSESIQVIFNYSAVSRTELFGVCVPRCMKDIRCNAFDICNGECRTIRGWLPIYTDSGSGDLCERHQIVRPKFWAMSLGIINFISVLKLKLFIISFNILGKVKLSTNL